jgi:fructose-bisphosphate aldolase/2-amino-3,7-dideoxy-D-threo-hept-6-ulosonate synthase
MVRDAMRAGAAGISIGRNIFQHDNIKGMTRAIARLVIENIEVDEAVSEITR